MADDERPIIIKRIKKIEGGHHGGAWKVAYADFVTAMMAFFLLLWLLNVSSEEQLKGIANYFQPTAVSKTSAGSGGVMGGITLSQEGALTSNREPMSIDMNLRGQQKKRELSQRAPVQESRKSEAKEENEAEKQKKAEEKRKNEAERLKKAMEDIKQAIADTPELRKLAQNLLLDITKEGLRIQIVDQEGKSMFPLGKDVMYDDTKLLIGKVSQIIQRLPNQVSIRGHTDGVPYGSNATYNNWDLSADRANASRRALITSGLDPDRIHNVIGKADTDHLFPDDPTSPQNRRVSIILLRDHMLDNTTADTEDQFVTEQSDL